MRQLLQVRQAWQQVMLSADEAAAFELPDEDSLLKKAYPWEPASDPNLATKDAVHLQLWKVKSEMKRCQEEIRYIPGDAKRVVAYYQRQVLLLAAHVTSSGGNGQQHGTTQKAGAGGQADCGQGFLLYHKLLELLHHRNCALKCFQKAGLM